MFDRRLLQPAGIFLAWLLGPVGLLLGLARVGIVAAMGPLLLVNFVVYPHEWLVRRSAYSSVTLFPPHVAPAVAIAQWTLAMIGFAALTRRLSPSRQAWLAPVTILGIGILILVLVSILGVTVEADWL